MVAPPMHLAGHYLQYRHSCAHHCVDCWYQVDLMPYRDRIAQTLTDNLHRDTRISGDIELLIALALRST